MSRPTHRGKLRGLVRGVSRSTPRGKLRGLARGVSRPTPRGKMRGLARGVLGPNPGGGWGFWPGGCLDPLRQTPPSRQLLLRTEHILLECIPVCEKFQPIGV